MSAAVCSRCSTIGPQHRVAMAGDDGTEFTYHVCDSCWVAIRDLIEEHRAVGRSMDDPTTIGDPE